MNNLSLVLRHIEAGRAVRFRQDFYGGLSVEVSWGWLRWPYRRVKLTAEEMAAVKAALARRSIARRGAKQGGMPNAA